METTTPPDAPKGSAFSRMFNVLAAPGEVFAEIKEQPVAHSNWLVPALIAMFVGVTAVFLLFSQDWAMYEVMKAQDKAMQQAVDQGKMKQADADRAVEMMKNIMPMMVKIGGAVASVVYAFGVPFFWGFIIWFIGVKILNGDFEYMKAVEAAGLATIIYTLSGLIGVLASLTMGKLTYLSAAFFLKEFDFTNKAHFALASINPFYLWFVAVIAIAAAKLSGSSVTKAAVWCFGLYVAVRAILIVLNLGQFAM